jgi:hypothetical protein
MHQARKEASRLTTVGSLGLPDELGCRPLNAPVGDAPPDQLLNHRVCLESSYLLSHRVGAGVGELEGVGSVNPETAVGYSQAGEVVECRHSSPSADTLRPS